MADLCTIAWEVWLETQMRAQRPSLLSPSSPAIRKPNCDDLCEQTQLVLQRWQLVYRMENAIQHGQMLVSIACEMQVTGMVVYTLI